MTKKDYIDLAAVLNNQINASGVAWVGDWQAFHDGRRAAIDAITDALCVTLHADNPRFNEKTFRAAVARERK